MAYMTFKTAEEMESARKGHKTLGVELFDPEFGGFPVKSVENSEDNRNKLASQTVEVKLKAPNYVVGVWACSCGCGSTYVAAVDRDLLTETALTCEEPGRVH